MRTHKGVVKSDEIWQCQSVHIYGSIKNDRERTNRFDGCLFTSEKGRKIYIKVNQVKKGLVTINEVFFKRFFEGYIVQSF